MIQSKIPPPPTKRLIHHAPIQLTSVGFKSFDDGYNMDEYIKVKGDTRLEFQAGYSFLYVKTKFFVENTKDRNIV